MRYLYVIALLAFVSCRNEYKVIPEEELGKIIVESVVAESFLKATNRITGYDSISYYLPILDKYGYTANDVDYTIERMVQRKSDVFGQLMTKISADVVQLRNFYEQQSNMGRNFRSLIHRDILDTLYFSPDTIHVRSYGELKKLDYKVPVFGDGDIIVKFNYIINEQDSNYSRYVTYSFEDSISKRGLYFNNSWLNKGSGIKRQELEIPIRNSYRGNMFDMRIFSYSSRAENPHPKSLKSIDFYIDSVMILQRPPAEEGTRRMYEKMGVPMMYDLGYEYHRERIITPFDTIYGTRKPYNRDSVRYHKKLPMAPNPNKKR